MIARILVGLVAAFFLFFALGFWFQLDRVMPEFGLATTNILGRASIRADFGGFFWGVGLFSLMAAIRASRNYAFGAMVLLGFALAGRLLSLLFDGAAPGGTVPMVVEAACIAILAWSRRGWTRKTS